jgi:hypothetical protein
VLYVLVVGTFACDEEYRECHPDRAPAEFPEAADRAGRCTAVCDHLGAIGCRLGCPYLTEEGLDGGVQTTNVDCFATCMTATDHASNASVDAGAVDRALRCYAGAETCGQVGACSRLCGAGGGDTWPEPLLCVADAGGADGEADAPTGAGDADQ